MNERSTKYIEVAANVSVIAAALLGCALLTRSLLPAAKVRPTPTAPLSAVSTLGTKVSLPGIDWAVRKQTFVLALSTTCRFCSESAPFFQRLAHEVEQRSDVRLIAVFPQDPKQGSDYLRRLSVPISDVFQAPLSTLGVRGTPAMILVDATGSVLKSAIGRIPVDRESEMLGWLK